MGYSNCTRGFIEEHPVSEESLRRFAQGVSNRQENRSIVAHLLKGCPDCARKVRERSRPEIPEDAYDSILTRLTGVPSRREAKVLRFEKKESAEQVPEDVLVHS